jgi:PTS hybrid protein
MEAEFRLDNAVGLHARPAAQLVRTVAPFAARVQITCGSRTADARSLLSLLALGAGRGSTITVQAEGNEAAEVIAAIADLVAHNFGE